MRDASSYREQALSWVCKTMAATFFGFIRRWMNEDQRNHRLLSTIIMLLELRSVGGADCWL